ncbi:hypothetical protein GQ53DRAFT_759933 [Thozetella sp. PMI_491]|nr:hypothetical protein GQ53DRAFT_759933 [Thozetella sp. PMI_491]
MAVAIRIERESFCICLGYLSLGREIYFPSFMLPAAHRRRVGLAAQVKRWHAHARQNFTESSIGPDGDADPYWGSELMRHRHSKLPAVDGFDEDCLVAADLGFIWASVSNATPTVFWVISHLFEDESLLDRARSEVAVLGTLDPKTLCQSASVLSSVFAETLRLHSNMYSMLTARGADAKLGKWRLPRGQIGVLLGRSFLVYPDDPTSGPLNQEMRHRSAIETKAKPEEDQEYVSGDVFNPGGPTFSLSGLEGSWIPYGVSQYNIELINGPVPVEFDTWGFGFNVAVPKRKIPFRIRTRE